jgi:hypothetical protein
VHADRVCRIAMFITLLTAPAAAQATGDASHWGVAGGVVPDWQTLSALKEVFTVDGLNMSGREFRVGIVRGRTMSGDWGVSFVRRSFESRTSLPGEDAGASCRATGRAVDGMWTGSEECLASRVAYLPFEVMLNGVELNKFIPFGTIKRRVQIGLNVAAGAGWTNDMVRRETREVEYSRPATGPVSQPVVFGDPGPETVRQIAEEPVEFRELLVGGISPMPLGKLELAVAVIAAPRLKVRVSGGLNFPGTHRVAVTMVYFFGQ